MKEISLHYAIVLMILNIVHCTSGPHDYSILVDKLIVYR